jgi:ABC-type antimicrobial peptide transport system permease subunit
MARLEPPEIGDRELLVALETDGAAAALAARLRTGGAGDLDVELAVIPEAAHNLASVRRLPLALAGFLALLAAGVSANAIAGTVRGRRRDLAVFRALGLTPRQARGVVASQATTIALVGVVAGVPLGLFVGRAGWQWVANSVPFVYRPPAAILAAIVVVPAAVAVVNLVGAFPGRAAARVRAAEVLRAE